MISENFKEILNRFEEESQKPIKGNEFAAKIRKNFSSEFNQLVLDLVGGDPLWEGKMSPGMMQWTTRPWAGLKNYDVARTFTDGFYLIYIFDIEKQKIYFSLDHGHNKYSKKVTSRIADELVHKIDFKLPEGFVTDRREELNHSSVMFKVYREKDLIEKDLIQDLEEMIKVYKKVIPLYFEVLNELGLEKKHTLDDYSQKKSISVEDRNIWRITAGGADATDLVWEEFKNNSYVGVGNWGIEKDINYIDFSSQDEIIEVILNTDTKRTQGARMAWDFSHEMNIGDVVIVNKGRSTVAGIGIIASDYIPATENKSKNIFGLNHIRKVNWITTDEFPVKKNLFPIITLNQVEPERWNEILTYYAKSSDEFKRDILEHLYLEFEREYLDTDAGKEHLSYYILESETLESNYKNIEARFLRGDYIADDVWYNMISPKNTLYTAYSNPRKIFQSNYNRSDDELNKIAVLFFRTVKEIIDNDTDFNKQKDIFSDLVNNPLSKGIKTGLITPSLHFLDDDFYVINKKTVDTVGFLSNFIGNTIKVNNDLLDYVDNNGKLHRFLIDIGVYLPEIKNYRIFDMFCHWLCANDLGNYARGNKLPLAGFEYDDGKNSAGTTQTPVQRSSVKLSPNMLELGDLKILENNLYRVCGALNANKHIILDGAPGTGKTELAIKFSEAAINENFIDGFLLTTATSDWTTFDTIGGFMPDEDGKLYFYEGKFLEAIRNNYWLIIDEINRSDIDKAFGQLFTVLSGQDVDLPYKDKNGKSIRIHKSSTKKDSFYDENSGTYVIGTNWRILATMNVYDKDSLFDLSYAFMRRFTFITIDIPENDVFEELIDIWADQLDQNYIESIKSLLGLNEKREFGPAIFKDMINYIQFRTDLDDTYDIIEEAILSYVIPQFDGLSPKLLKEIDTFFDEKELNTPNIKAKLKEFCGSEL